MPDEYISREKTLALLKSLGSRDYRREKGTIQDTIKMISSAAYTPAADVAPVEHAQWLLDRWPSWPHRECSRCKTMFPRTTEVADQYWQYCPNCGARMDGGNGA